MKSVVELDLLLQAYKEGRLDADTLKVRLQEHSCRLSEAQLDTGRTVRTGVGEVVYCQGKTDSQLQEIFSGFIKRDIRVLGTRASQSQFVALQHSLQGLFPEESLSPLNYNEKAGLLCWQPEPVPSRGKIAVVSAGACDQAVAEEAAGCAAFFGSHVERFYDCGVAGVHRLFAVLPDLLDAAAVIVVAGMDGALPTVVAGLIEPPVIAVPTSVGYGTGLGGTAALLTMLNGCAPGVSVVNIDNGFGAGYQAHIINARSRRYTQEK